MTHFGGKAGFCRLGSSCRLHVGFRLLHVSQSEAQAGFQWLQGMFFSWQIPRAQKATSSAKAHFKLILVPCPLTSFQSKKDMTKSKVKGKFTQLSLPQSCGKGEIYNSFTEEQKVISNILISFPGPLQTLPNYQTTIFCVQSCSISSSFITDLVTPLLKSILHYRKNLNFLVRPMSSSWLVLQHVLFLLSSSYHYAIHLKLKQNNLNINYN